MFSFSVSSIRQMSRPYRQIVRTAPTAHSSTPSIFAFGTDNASFTKRSAKNVRQAPATRTAMPGIITGFRFTCTCIAPFKNRVLHSASYQYTVLCHNPYTAASCGAVFCYGPESCQMPMHRFHIDDDKKTDVRPKDAHLRGTTFIRMHSMPQSALRGAPLRTTLFTRALPDDFCQVPPDALHPWASSLQTE